MATANVYSAEPALPVLADTLLSPSPTPKPRQPNNTWSLQQDLENGIHPNSSIFRSGVIIGFSRIRAKSPENNEYIGQIPRYLLTTHLRSRPASPDPSAFIIHPNTFSAFSARTLLNDLLSPHPSHSANGLSRDEAIQRLDSVHLLPVHDFAGAAQAVSKVSNELQEMHSQRLADDQTNRIAPDARAALLIVVGLDTLAEGVIRTSNPVKGAALLAATLRTLTRVSRVHGSSLSVLLVNTHGLGSMYSGADGRAASSTHHRADTQDDQLHSIFRSTGPSLLSNLLTKTLDQGIDTHLLLSDVKGAQVVEVIKDRVGSGAGKWSVWIQGR
ncbi:hypothetical protein N7474_009744 [Penicillium riverlandense]|uniref:uncharacterized protein n=1 Tax=Penicillium riverlandense TaxID=1903569 RepID=UPI0025475B86|nr:uncharacterized protein N7474_009744 [Penicillium riverlandense]KAJ5808475.1 hypothetical protein N7474_009744 [Penicillium riverlandense]